jgi:hypothetical protein
VPGRERARNIKELNIPVRSPAVLRIRDTVIFLTPGDGIRIRYGEKIRIRDEHPRSFFRELRNSFFGLKIFKFFDADPDPGSRIFSALDPG